MRVLQTKSGAARQRSPRGLGVIEIVVVLAIISLVAMAIVMMLPRQREASRRASCQMNLSRIGQAVILYSQIQRKLPGVPDLGEEAAAKAPSPLATLMEFAGDPDFAEVVPKKRAAGAPKGPVPIAERHVSGFVCPSDPTATSRLWKAPVNYRANTGDTPEGANGPFAPGKAVRLEDIEAADGASYSALFSERLVGNGLNEPHARNYKLVPAPVGRDACPTEGDTFWRGDAGSSWLAPSWRATLYNHALPPGYEQSCIAADDRSAHMQASSGHLEGVHLLMADGAVQTFTRKVDAALWKRLGNYHDVP